VRVCVLKSGGEYGPNHVHWLARQVPHLVCLTDMHVPGIVTIPLEHNYPGWWSKLELCRPDIAGDLMYFDLDTVVKSVPVVQKTTVLRDFYHPDLVGSGLMYLTEADRAKCWEAWIKDPSGHMKACTKFPKYGDQGFFGEILHDADRWQDVLPGKVTSYKAGAPRDWAAADIICFHGKPRPWGVRLDWVPPL